jgi:hypothetical protein
MVKPLHENCGECYPGSTTPSPIYLSKVLPLAFSNQLVMEAVRRHVFLLEMSP